MRPEAIRSIVLKINKFHKFHLDVHVENIALEFPTIFYMNSSSRAYGDVVRGIS